MISDQITGQEKKSDEEKYISTKQVNDVQSTDPCQDYDPPQVKKDPQIYSSFANESI